MSWIGLAAAMCLGVGGGEAAAATPIPASAKQWPEPWSAHRIRILKNQIQKIKGTVAVEAVMESDISWTPTWIQLFGGRNADLILNLVWRPHPNALYHQRAVSVWTLRGDEKEKPVPVLEEVGALAAVSPWAWRGRVGVEVFRERGEDETESSLYLPVRGQLEQVGTYTSPRLWGGTPCKAELRRCLIPTGYLLLKKEYCHEWGMPEGAANTPSYTSQVLRWDEKEARFNLEEQRGCDEAEYSRSECR